MDDITILKRLNKQPGSVVRVHRGRQAGDWIKLDASVSLTDTRELELAWVNLKTGALRHYSWLVNPPYLLGIVREGAGS